MGEDQGAPWPVCLDSSEQTEGHIVTSVFVSVMRSGDDDPWAKPVQNSDITGSGLWPGLPATRRVSLIYGRIILCVSPDGFQAAC